MWIWRAGGQAGGQVAPSRWAAGFAAAMDWLLPRRGDLLRVPRVLVWVFCAVSAVGVGAWAVSLGGGVFVALAGGALAGAVLFALCILAFAGGVVITSRESPDRVQVVVRHRGAVGVAAARVRGGTATAAGLAAWPRGCGAGMAAAGELFRVLETQGVARVELTAATTRLAMWYAAQWGFAPVGRPRWFGRVRMVKVRPSRA